MTTNKRYIIEKYNYDIYDDYYILHSLKNIVKKINILKKENNNIKVLLVSMNSGKVSQVDKGRYKYIEISINEFRKSFSSR